LQNRKDCLEGGRKTLLPSLDNLDKMGRIEKANGKYVLEITINQHYPASGIDLMLFTLEVIPQPVVQDLFCIE
jgi:hypothetical protein